MVQKLKEKLTLSNAVSAFLVLVTLVILGNEIYIQHQNDTVNWPQATGITGVAMIFLSLSKSPNLITPGEDGSINLSRSGYIYGFIAGALLLISLIWTWITVY